ncbi:MAG: hypothetical protein P8R42_07275 [Candidatus Binatia bacterium]|nr:hypothetical protein [Candidatus Binatia bacterium]
MVARSGPPHGGQNWRTFVGNHGAELWACDFLTQYTATFAVAYVFVITEISSRCIVHANVTASPTLAWVKQQMREATAWADRAFQQRQFTMRRFLCELVRRKTKLFAESAGQPLV